MKRRLRLVLVSHSYVERQNQRAAAALARIAEVRVIVPSAWHNGLRDEPLLFEPSDMGAAGFGSYRRLPLFGTQFLLGSVDLGLRRFRPDVICVEYDPWHAVFWQTLLCRALFARRAKLVCHVKKNTHRRYSGVRGKVKSALVRLSVDRVDHYLAASEMTARMYRDTLGVPPSRVSVVPHLPVDIDLFHPSERAGHPERLVVGYCGSLSEHKGVPDLVAAVERARGSGAEHLELALLGDGPLRSSLAALAQTRSWLRVEGPVPNDDVAAFMTTLDLFVMPSHVLDDHEEHDGHAIGEALAAGLPVVGTRSGIIPELLRDGVGIVVGPSDVDGLAKAILALVRDPARRRELSVRGRERAEAELGPESVALRKVDVLQGVIA